MREPLQKPNLTPQQLARKLTVADIEEIFAGLLPEVKHAIKHATEPLLVRIAALEARAATFKYAGVYARDRDYAAGEFTTFRGSLWHCNRSTRATPGDGTSDWTLACKRGRDGKDAGSGGG